MCCFHKFSHIIVICFLKYVFFNASLMLVCFLLYSNCTSLTWRDNNSNLSTWLKLAIIYILAGFILQIKSFLRCFCVLSICYEQHVFRHYLLIPDSENHGFAGIESFSKLGDSIYFEEEADIPSLYIIQYISSSLNWTSGQIILNQKVDPVASLDPNLRVTFTFSAIEVLFFYLLNRCQSKHHYRD